MIYNKVVKMCFNLIWFGKFDKRVFRRIAIDKSRYNKDGYFIESNDIYLRTLSFPNFISEIDKIVDGSKELIHLHMRQRTVGKVNEENIHGWKFANWTFSHNGHVYGLKSDDGHSDSFNLFKKITESLTYDNVKLKELKTIIENSGFYGVAFLLNRQNKRLVVISADKHANIFRKDDYTIISNEPIDDLLFSRKIKYLGVSMVKLDYEYGYFNNKIVYIDLEKEKVLNSINISVKRQDYRDLSRYGVYIKDDWREYYRFI